MLNLSTLNVCARATCGPATLTARRTAGIGSEYFVIGSPKWMQVARPRSSLRGLGVCRRANEVYLPRASEADARSVGRPTLTVAFPFHTAISNRVAVGRATIHSLTGVDARSRKFSWFNPSTALMI